MITIMAGLGLLTALALLCSLSTADGERLTRRGCVRLLILGASGLSWLPACLLSRRPAHGDDGPEGEVADDPLLARWARLGRVWREMSRHLDGKLGDPQGAAEFEQLKVRMENALEALPAWPELRVVFTERWAHIHRERYVMATCYRMAPGGPLPARTAVEEQVQELSRLVAERKLSTEAARKAAEALAVQAEYLVKLHEAGEESGDRRQWEMRRELWKQYKAGEVDPGPNAELAGQRLAELTVDDLGLLAGPPQENEGADSGGGGAETVRQEGEQ